MSKKQKLPFVLFVLGLGGIGIGLTEFAIVGLLPSISSDLKVSAAKAGTLVSYYAISVAIGGIFLTGFFSRLNSKLALVSLIGLFAIGNAISASSHSFTLVMFGRCLSGASHGAFFGIGAVVAIGLVEINRRSSAISIMFGGLTVANVLGVPFGSWVGLHFGWPAALFVIAVIGFTTLLGLVVFLPATISQEKNEINEGALLRVFRKPQVWYSLLMTIFGFGGMFGAYTYIVFTLEKVSKFSAANIPVLLLIFGVGVFIGNVVGGRFADRNLDKALTVELTGLFIVLLAFSLTAHSKVSAVICLLLMGLFGFAPASALQLRVLHYSAESPSIASGANIASFNIGNALGAWLGGILISSKLGYASPLWGATGITSIALIVMIFSQIHLRKLKSITN